MVPRVRSSTCYTDLLVSSFYLGCMLQALAILYQPREVALVTGGYLHLVLFRAYCCCCELRAAGRAYSHLLLLVQKSKRHIPTYQKNTKHPKHPRLKKHFFSSRNPMYLLAAALNTEMISLTCSVCSPHNRFGRSRRDRRGQNTRLCIFHVYVCRNPLFCEQMRLVLWKPENNILRIPSWERRSDWPFGWAV